MTLTKSLILALGLTATAVSATETAPKQVRFTGDTQFASFCKAIVMDDVKVLRSSVARNVGRIGASQREVLRLITADGGLTCNGTSLIDFSIERDASAVREYLTSRS